MLRDTSLLYEVADFLKQNHFINHNSETLLTDSQRKHIWGFFDDLTVESFFRSVPLKPIIITPEHTNVRFTPSGYAKITEETILNLSDPYDRYTFLKVILQPNFLSNICSQRNKFIDNLYYGYKKFGCYSTCFIVKPDYLEHPYIDAFNHEFRYIDFDYNRASSLYCFRDFMRNFSKEREYEINISMSFAERISDYAAVKNQEIFEGVNLEYVLSIYSILVEKLIIDHEHISPVLAFALGKESDMEHPLQLFHNFELNLPTFFNVEKYFDMRDVLLRFVNAVKSRAFSFDFHKPYDDYVSIRFFSEPAITSVIIYNTLPLPYYYNK